MADPRVLRAMSAPLLGQFDPEFTAIMNEVIALSRLAFQTRNAQAFPVSGTGRAGLEAAIGSLVEPGDRVLVDERGALNWHTVRDVSGEYVSTEENHVGFRMDALVRHVRKGVAA